MVDMGTPNVVRVVPRHRQQLSAEVAAHVREKIVSGQLRPGTFIRQEKIAEDLGLSATPVREGLLALRGEGFVQLKPRRGFVVAPLAASDIRDVFTAQALIAGELASRAAQLIGADELEQLEALHTSLAEAASEGDADRVEELNHLFHRTLNLVADAPKLAWVLSLTVHFAPHHFFATIEGWPAASANDHHAIVSALRARNSEAAREAMRLHIENAGRLLADHFNNLGAQQTDDHATG